jgi:hypothetical protein
MHYGFVQFMVDCAIRSERRLEPNVSVHRLQQSGNAGPCEWPSLAGGQRVSIAVCRCTPRQEECRAVSFSQILG